MDLRDLKDSSRLSLRSLLPARQDQVIAYSRLLLSGVALIAIYIDPTQPTRFSLATYAILSAYVLWAIVLAIRAWLRPGDMRGALWGHLIDLCVFAALIYLTEGPSSPFFVFFTFSIVSAGLRWGARGAVATAAVILAFFLVSTLATSATESIDTNRAIVRAAYLVVAALLIGYFGWRRERSNEQLQRLAEWPAVSAPLADDPPIATSLEHAALILDIGRLAVVWEEDGEGEWHVADWTGTECRFSRWPSDRSPLSAGEGMDRTLPSSDLLEFLAAGEAVISPFEAPRHAGAVLILDPTLNIPNTTELRHLSKIVARRIVLELEQHRLRRELAEAAISRERERLARDLHDGILQDLAAVGLHLEAISRSTPEPHLSTIRDLATLVGEQQARIRSFVAMMNPRMGRSQLVALGPALKRSAAALERQWSATVNWSLEPEDAQVTESQELHLRSLLGEAVANAVRHGGATKLHVEARIEDSICLRIEDNGRPKQMPPGVMLPSTPVPMSLQQRVLDLGGEYAFSIDAGGGRLSLTLPRGI